MVRLSFAVWAISGVCEFEKTVPLLFRKFNRCGICSRSDGTFGLSREKCTLSNTMLITCLTPLPRLHDGAAAALSARAAVGPALALVEIAATAASSAVVAPRRPSSMKPRRPSRPFIRSISPSSVVDVTGGSLPVRWRPGGDELVAPGARSATTMPPYADSLVRTVVVPARRREGRLHRSLQRDAVSEREVPLPADRGCRRRSPARHARARRPQRRRRGRR